MSEASPDSVTACKDDYQGPRCGSPTRTEIFQGIYCACERPQQTPAPKGRD